MAIRTRRVNTLMHALQAQREATAVIAKPIKPAMSQQEVDETLSDWEEHLARKAVVAARLA